MVLGGALGTAGSAAAQDLKFPIGEDAKFNWKSLEDFKAAHSDLSGQTLTIFGPWRGEDEGLRLVLLAHVQQRRDRRDCDHQKRDDFFEMPSCGHEYLRRRRRRTDAGSRP